MTHQTYKTRQMEILAGMYHVGAKNENSMTLAHPDKYGRVNPEVFIAEAAQALDALLLEVIASHTHKAAINDFIIPDEIRSIVEGEA